MVKVPDKPNFFVAEAAKILNMHRVTLYRKIERGEIEVHFYSERITIIPRESIIAYLKKTEKQRLDTHSVA